MQEALIEDTSSPSWMSYNHPSEFSSQTAFHWTRVNETDSCDIHSAVCQTYRMLRCTFEIIIRKSSIGQWTIWQVFKFIFYFLIYGGSKTLRLVWIQWLLSIKISLSGLLKALLMCPSMQYGSPFGGKNKTVSDGAVQNRFFIFYFMFNAHLNWLDHYRV